MLLVLLAIVPALGVTFYMGLEQWRIATAHAQQEALWPARLASIDHERLIEGTRQPLVALAHLPALRKHEPGACSAFVAALALAWLKHLVAEVRLAQGSTFTVIDRNGTIVASDPNPDKWVEQSALA